MTNSFKDNEILQDRIRIEGINCLGYGIIFKKVMIDTELSIDAKAIFAYFCSFAGNGDSAFPGRNKILKDLNISKNTYHKHLSALKEKGYITVEHRFEEGHKGRLHNLYTIKSFPSCMNEVFEQDPIAAKAGIRYYGYGMIPKAIMIDETILLKAKALYAYYCSFAGAGATVEPEKKNILYHLGISESTYCKISAQLRDTGYITIMQKNSSGKFGYNTIILNELVGGREEQRRDEEKWSESPHRKNWDVKICDVKKRDVKKCDINFCDSNNNNNKSNNSEKQQSINQSFRVYESNKTDDTNEVGGLMDICESDKAARDYKAIDKHLREQVGYDLIVHKRKKAEESYEAGKIDDCEYEELCAQYDIQTADRIIGYMTDLIIGESSKTVSIAGTFIPRVVVQGKLMKIDHFQFRKVVTELYCNTRIKNPKGYAITMLYNS